jgi:hypothetical protein
MTLYKFTNGTVADATEVNANVNKSLSLPILNKVRQNQDRSVDTSSNKEDIFSDAYIDANGRQDTVNTGNTTALYNSSLLTYSNDNATASGTTEELGAYSATPTNKTTNMEYTCSANADLYVKDLQMVCDGSGTGTMTVKLERVTGSGEYTTIYTKSGTYSSGTSNFASTLADYGGVYIPNGKNFKVLCTLNANDLHQENTSQPTVSGTLFDIDEGKASQSTANRVIFGSSGGISCESITTTSNTTKVIEHTIPAGTFSSTVSTLIGKALIYSTETGASITHRLENATENSGDIADGELGTFTAFTSEPTKYIVKLTSKSSGATPGLPVIKGSGVLSE